MYLTSPLKEFLWIFNGGSAKKIGHAPERVIRPNPLSRHSAIRDGRRIVKLMELLTTQYLSNIWSSSKRSEVRVNKEHFSFKQFLESF